MKSMALSNLNDINQSELNLDELEDSLYPVQLFAFHFQ